MSAKFCPSLRNEFCSRERLILGIEIVVVNKPTSNIQCPGIDRIR
jgi:hypothetical protein